MSNILTRFFLGPVICLALISISYLIWQEESLYRKVIKGEIALDSDSFQGSLDGFAKRHLRQALYQEYIQETVAPEYMVKVASSYLTKHPLDAKAWLWSSVFNHRAKNYQAADKHLSNAHRLSLKHASNLERIFNRYVELGKYEQALDVAQSLSYANFRSFRRLFYVMGRLYPNYDVLVQKIIPSSVPSQPNRLKELDADYYYNIAMSDAIRVKNVELAKSVWHGVPSALRVNSSLGLRYIEFLAKTQKIDALESAWTKQSKGKLVHGSLDHQSYSEKNSPCWRLVPYKGETVSYEVVTTDVGEELKVVFSGDENVDFAHIYCILLLSPESQYILAGEWKGDGLTTLSGPFFDIYAPKLRNSYNKTDSKTGYWPWERFEMKFATDKGGAYILRLRRSKTDYLDNKIAGTLYLRRLEIKELASELLLEK